MAAPVSVVEDAEDHSFLPLIHDIIKWYEYLHYMSHHTGSKKRK